MKKNYIILIILIIIYFLLKYFIPYGNYIVYPINLMVTFLHEFGHSLFALLTGWSVKSMQINTDGSGYAITAGWWSSLILIGWYIGSAIFWNILLYIWFKKQKLSQYIIYLLSWLLIFSAIIWFNSIISTIILLLLAGLLILISKNKNYNSVVLQFLWITTLLHIIEDFNVWPKSDISKFGDIFIVIPDFLWMIIWLIIVVWITGWNIKNIIKK